MQTQKTVNLEDIKNGCCYSFPYQPTPEWWSQHNLKKGRGKDKNPLWGHVSVYQVIAGQACTMDWYQREALRLNPAWQPSTTPLRQATDNPCVFVNLATGRNEVMLKSCRTTKLVYYVDGIEATPAQIRAIKASRLSKGNGKPATTPKVKFPYADNLTNIEGELPPAIED